MDSCKTGSRRYRGLVVVALVVYRSVCAFLQQTAFAPDEYWQGPEISHRLVFGYGHMTWEWIAGIRSYVHPLMYAVVYQALLQSGMDGSRWLVARGPQLVHVILTVWCDVYVYKLTRAYFEDENVAAVAWICQLLNWFGSYCLLRTYSSSIEACLTSYALYSYVKYMKLPTRSRKSLRTNAKRGRQHEDPKRMWKSAVAERTARWVLCAALCVVLRPASGAFWILIALHAVVTNKRCRVEIINTGLVVGLGILCMAAMIDRFMYGRWEFVPWNFLKFNVLHRGSSLYGENPWHANFTTHLPSMLLSYMPFFGLGCITCIRKRQWHLVAAIASYCLVYSIPSHKEIRFLLPALIMCMPIIAIGLTQFVSRHTRARAGVYTSVFVLQIIAFLYFSLLHQRGQVQVMRTVYDIHTLHKNNKVLFLTPCHATPYYSFLHSHPSMRFFDCSPREFRDQVYMANEADMEWIRIPGHEADIYSEREYFENNPARVLASILTNVTKPHIIVSFASTSQKIHPLLEDHGYSLHTRHKNCVLSFEENTECIIEVHSLHGH